MLHLLLESKYYFKSKFLLYRKQYYNSLNLGVIYSPKAEVRSAPNKYSTRLFQVHEGLKVHVENSELEWIEIELIDGKSGWITNDEIKLVN